jgi:hypothetical protein
MDPRMVGLKANDPDRAKQDTPQGPRSPGQGSYTCSRHSSSLGLDQASPNTNGVAFTSQPVDVEHRSSINPSVPISVHPSADHLRYDLHLIAL